MKPKTAHLIRKIKALPADKINTVKDFVDFLHHKNAEKQLTHTASRLAEESFGKVWNNPEDAVYDHL
jgi:hypothetical protein